MKSLGWINNNWVVDIISATLTVSLNSSFQHFEAKLWSWISFSPLATFHSSPLLLTSVTSQYIAMAQSLFEQTWRKYWICLMTLSLPYEIQKSESCLWSVKIWVSVLKCKNLSLAYEIWKPESRFWNVKIWVSVEPLSSLSSSAVSVFLAQSICKQLQSPIDLSYIIVLLWAVPILLQTNIPNAIRCFGASNLWQPPSLPQDSNMASLLFFCEKNLQLTHQEVVFAIKHIYRYR